MNFHALISALLFCDSGCLVNHTVSLIHHMIVYVLYERHQLVLSRIVSVLVQFTGRLIMLRPFFFFFLPRKALVQEKSTL